MTRLFDRWLPCVTLLSWSTILLYFYFSGRVIQALHPSFRPGVVLAGFVLLALAAVFLLAPASAEDCCDDECAQPLARLKIGKILTFAILILPVAGATVLAPEGFSAKTVLNRGISLELPSAAQRQEPSIRVEAPEPSVADAIEPPLPTKDGVAQAEAPPAGSADSFIPKTPEGYLALQVIDLLYAAQDPDLRKEIEGKTVELTGQWMPDTVSNVTGNRFKLVRMFMMCCAADARPVAALVEGKNKGSFAEMDWVKVVGRAAFPTESGRTVAVVEADSLSAAEPPDETMLY